MRQTAPVISVKESDIQASIRELLTQVGYIVRQTSVRGWRGTKGYGTDKGIADLLVTREGWGCTCELEVKGPKTAISKEQEALVNQGVICIVRSMDDALLCLRRFEKRLSMPGYASKTWKPSKDLLDPFGVE
jgi:hypothetical protein